MNARFFLLFALVWAVAGLRAADRDYGKSYDGGFEPVPPEAFPKAYGNYQILPGSISPDGQHALIYPKRGVLYTLSDYGLYLAALKPFRALREIPVGNSNLAGNARNGYAVRWAKDSSTVVAIVESRWGAERVSVLRLQHGDASKPLDLTAQVRKQLQAGFKVSGAARYNDYYDYVFYAGPDDKWFPNEQGQVIIDCTCTTDPKDIDSGAWTARFQGVWSLAEGKFVEKKFERLRKAFRN